MQLGKAETFRIFYHNDIGVGNVHPNLNHRCGNQDVNLSFRKPVHNFFLFCGLHLSVQGRHRYALG